ARPFPGDARPRRPARHPRPLPVRARLDAAAARTVGGTQAAGRRAGRDRAGAAAVVGAGEPGAGAARQPGALAPRGVDLSGAAVRGLRPALAARSPLGPGQLLRRAARSPHAPGGTAAAGRAVGADRAAGPRPRLPAALA